MSEAFTPVTPVLEPAAQAFVEATANPPYLFDLAPAEGRKAVDEVQSGEIAKPAVDEEWITVQGGPTGTVRARIVKPAGTTATLPVIIYIHGAGWVFGNAHTHDRLVRELAVGANAAVVFPEYDLSPEARYPVAIEQNYAVAQWVVTQGATKDLDPTRIAVAGDSVGGNMTAALTLMAKERGDVPLLQQVLFYPVTDASFDTASYHQFAEGYFLRRDGMFWFWDQYTTDEAERAQITASPLRATTEQLTGLPPALVIVAEADVLRDEGEAYANKLREAGVPVTAVR
ncbi:alpha/beta hydrolase, partial [Streptomyces sp. NPDC002172]